MILIEALTRGREFSNLLELEEKKILEKEY